MQQRKVTYSCKELADLRLPGKPTTRQGWDAIVNKEQWEFVEIPSAGKLGKTKEYFPSNDVLELIEVLPSSDSVSLAREVNQVHEEYKPHGDVVFIEEYKYVRGAAGAGQITTTDQVIVQVAINAKNFRDHVGVSTDKIKIITVFGDSMKPTLSHGDQVFVDTSCRSFVDDAIYAIQQGDVLRIKRIYLRFDGSVVIKSDNDKGFPVETYTSDEASHFKVVGRVIPFKFGMFDA